MPNYRRNFAQGGTFFFTVVSAGRMPLFGEESARTLLGTCFRQERVTRPFSTDAIVLLPDHLHALWTLPSGDFDFSTRWSSIKSRFTREWLTSGGTERAVLPGQHREQRRGIWQPRFFEHTIRGEDDLIRHADYIHFNPVKHALVACPSDWDWSSFQRFVHRGDYPIDGACSVLGPTPRFDALDANLLE